MKDIDVKQLGAVTQRAFAGLRNYSTFIFILGILFAYLFLIIQINTLSKATPNEDAVAEKANTVKRLKLDQAAIDKIQQLEDQNVGVKSLFDNARDNPFQE